jgi:hypothetical protein
MAKKTTCPITRGQFRTKAKPVTVSIGNTPQVAEVKEFSTGSLGWYLNGKTTIEIDGTPVAVQIGLNLTVVGSKELPEEAPAKPAAAPSPAPVAAAVA